MCEAEADTGDPRTEPLRDEGSYFWAPGKGFSINTKAELLLQGHHEDVVMRKGPEASEKQLSLRG